MYIDEFFTRYFAGVESKVIASLKKLIPIKALKLWTADTKMLEFSEEITELSEVVPGTSAKVEGKPAEGKYLMPNGVTLLFEGGKLTKKIDPTYEELQATNLKLKAQLKETHEVLSEVSRDFSKLTETLKAEVKKGIGIRRPFNDLNRKPTGKRIPFHK